MNRKHVLLLAAIWLAAQVHMGAKTSLKALQVEYMPSPLAVNIGHPRFAWQMEADDQKKGWRQTAYRIAVTDEAGREVWNSGRVKSDSSLGIAYDGQTLKPATRYTWTLEVWNQKNERMTATSSFETALTLVPDYNHSAAPTDFLSPQAWCGAKWIGRGADPTIFYAHYLPVFKLAWDVQLDSRSESTAASLVFGANDPRLMSWHTNLFGRANEPDSSFVRVELDIAPLNENRPARLNVYRKGYTATDNGAVPFTSCEIPADIVGAANRYAKHHIAMACNAGGAVFSVDNTRVGEALLNPHNPKGKQGGDYICYPMVGDMGYQLNAGQKAAFSDVEVLNYRQPSRTIITVQGEAVTLEGGTSGLLQISPLKLNTVPMMRSVFKAADRKITRARLYATAQGVYDLYINGTRVGDAYFNPGSTEYGRTLTYQTFDVTGLLKPGQANAIGAIVSEGWWSGAITYVAENWNLYGDRQALLAKLQITYDDGTQQCVVTSPHTWKTYDDGPTRYSSFFQGEVYDARKEAATDGWATADYDDRNWQSAVEVRDDHFDVAPDFQLLADMADPILPIDTLTAQSVREVKPGAFVYDLGQNTAGVPLVTFSGLKPGTEVKLRFAEVTYPDLPASKDYVGMIMTENLRLALCQDLYIAKGGEETFSPRFSSRGFRYIEISGVDKAVPTTGVRAIAISSTRANSSLYETSNADVNRLWLNAVWSTRSNFLSIPTDCPQRNERLGWMGDISVFGRSATYIADAGNFLRRYLISVRDMQADNGRYPDVAPTGCGFGGLLWGSAGITVPWELYKQYGDKSVLAEHYPSMKRYLDYVASDCIDPATGIIVQYRQWADLGDWLSLEDTYDKSLVWEAYYIYDLDIMQRMAEVLGKTDDAARYAQLAARRRDFFVKTYVDTATGKTHCSAFDAKRKGEPVHTQTSYALPLAFNIVDGELRTKMAANLKETIVHNSRNYPPYSLLTGFIGTSWLCKALSDNGMSDVAYRMLQHDAFPSWLYPVKNGATSVWERLNSYTIKDGFGGNNSMNSFNHYSFGAVAAWMYNYSLGITRDETSTGFKHFVLKPEPDPTGRMTHAEGHYDSMYGRIESSWKREGGKTVYNFTVPANTSATLYLPTPKGTKQKELKAGKYRFEVKE